jgi:uncharacterized protein YcfL
MKFVVATFGLLALVGCSSGPQYAQQNLVIDRNVPAMSRNEVINGIAECEGNGARAVMVYGKRQINGFTADVVVDVTCAPRYRF